MKSRMIGQGNTAEVFAFDENKVLKLFFKGYPGEYVEKEFQNAKELFRLQLPTPKPFAIVEMEERCGIVYERIDGKSLLDALEGGEMDPLSVLDRQTTLHRALLRKHTNAVSSYKEVLLGMLRGHGVEDPTLTAEIQALPDGDTLLHGDFHPGNILTKPDGTAVLIDAMNVCRGPAQFDIARSFFLLSVSAPLAEEYLRRMQTTKEEIAPFLSVIKACRKYEAQG